MVSISHSLNFVTEFDETHPISQQFLALDKDKQIAMLQGMLKEIFVPILLPEINKVNEGGSYAILKVVA